MNRTTIYASDNKIEKIDLYSCGGLCKHIRYVLYLYFGYNQLGDKYTEGKDAAEEAANSKIQKALLVIFGNLPNVYIQLYEYLKAGFTHRWLVNAGLTSPSLVMNFYFSHNYL